MRVVVHACDVCEAHDATTYQIKKGEQAAKIDLCEEHAQPLLALLKKATPPKKRAPRRPRATTVEEIEAKKKK